MPVTIRPETLQDTEPVILVKPNRPTEVGFVVGGINDPKLAATPGEDVLVLFPNFEPRAEFHSIANVADNPVHNLEIEAEDKNFRMLMSIEKASRVCELRSAFAC